MTLNDAIEEARASASVNQFELETIELIHPMFVDESDNPDSIRCVLDEQDWDLLLEPAAPLKGGQVQTFKAIAFRSIKPAQEEASFGDVRLAFDWVSREVQPWIDEAVSVRADGLLICRTWLANYNQATKQFVSTGGPVEVLGGLTVRDIAAGSTSIELTAKFKDLLNRGFPRRYFDIEDWPGLFG